MTTTPTDFDTDPRWSPSGWRALAAAQQPVWPDAAALDAALDELRASPPLVYAGETRALTDSLAARPRGEGFLLHAGDCAESFAEFSADKVRDQIKVILQMSVVLTYSTGLPTLKLGRIAGQYAKPRSAPTEERGDVELESFRGDIVNGIDFDYEARRARSAPPGARLRAGIGHPQSVAFVHERRLRRPLAGAPLEPRVRRHHPRGRALRPAVHRDRSRPALHGRVRHRPHQGTPTPRGRSLHVARGAAPRLTKRRSPGPTRSTAAGTTRRRTCSGSGNALANSTAWTCTSSVASTIRSP